MLAKASLTSFARGDLRHREKLLNQGQPRNLHGSCSLSACWRARARNMTRSKEVRSPLCMTKPASEFGRARLMSGRRLARLSVLTSRDTHVI